MAITLLVPFFMTNSLTGTVKEYINTNISSLKTAQIDNERDLKLIVDQIFKANFSQKSFKETRKEAIAETFRLEFHDKMFGVHYENFKQIMDSQDYATDSITPGRKLQESKSAEAFINGLKKTSQLNFPVTFKRTLNDQEKLVQLLFKGQREPLIRKDLLTELALKYKSDKTENGKSVTSEPIESIISTELRPPASDDNQEEGKLEIEERPPVKIEERPPVKIEERPPVEIEERPPVEIEERPPVEIEGPHLPVLDNPEKAVPGEEYPTKTVNGKSRGQIVFSNVFRTPVTKDKKTHSQNNEKTKKEPTLIEEFYVGGPANPPKHTHTPNSTAKNLKANDLQSKKRISKSTKQKRVHWDTQQKFQKNKLNQSEL